MEHGPCGFLGDATLAMEFVAADAVLAADQVDCLIGPPFAPLLGPTGASEQESGDQLALPRRIECGRRVDISEAGDRLAGRVGVLRCKSVGGRRIIRLAAIEYVREFGADLETRSLLESEHSPD